MNRVKLCAYMCCALSFVYAHGAAADQAASCEGRGNDLRELFSAKYIALDAQCAAQPCEGAVEPEPKPQPSTSEDSPVVSSPAPSENGEGSSRACISEGSVGVCGWPLSPECAAAYDALSAEVAAAWEKLYAECPDLEKPGPVEGGEDRSSTQGPLFRAPTASELFDTVNVLKKRNSRLRKLLRRERSNVRQCRSTNRSQ